MGWLRSSGTALSLAGALAAPSATARHGSQAAAPVTPGDRCAASAGPLVRLTSRRGLVATIAPRHGAELVGLSVEVGGRPVDLLYRSLDFCAHPGWDGKAPILWPATGRTYVDGGAQPGWRWRGAVYPIAIHGFARDLPWKLVAGGGPDSSSATMVLSDGAATRRVYPFGFRFELTYRLRGDVLEMRHRIRAAADNVGAMPFSLGNHITFRAPLSGVGIALVTSPARKQVLLDAAGRPTGETRALADGVVRRPVGTFGRQQAFSLADFPGTPWARLDDAGGVSVTLSHRGDRMPDGVPVMFNLWGDPDEGFFSVEPWWGKQDSLSTGDGVVRLAPGRTFSWTLRIRVSAGGAGVKPTGAQAAPT